MIALTARYDGKVIVPDTPLDLPANQRVRISVEALQTDDAASQQCEQQRQPPPNGNGVDLRKLIGWAERSGPTNPNPRFPNEDSLWDRSLENPPPPKE